MLDHYCPPHPPPLLPSPRPAPTPVYQLYMQEKCDEWAALSVNDHRPCRQHGIELPFVVDIPSLRAALTSALQHIERPRSQGNHERREVV